MQSQMDKIRMPQEHIGRVANVDQGNGGITIL